MTPFSDEISRQEYNARKASEQRSRYARDPEARRKNKENGKRWRLNNPEKHRQQNRKAKLKRFYNLTPEEYDSLLASQEGRCAICRELPVKPVVDHDHVTGKVRGILCDGCNVGLGRFKDDLSRLEAAVAYMKRTK